MKIKLIISVFVFFIIGSATFYFMSKRSHQTNTQKIETNMMADKTLVTPVAQKTIPAQIAKDTDTIWLEQKIAVIKPLAHNLSTNVLKLSLTAYQHAQKRGITNNPILTVIDYSKPSNERRLWVIDVEKNKVLFNTLVAHGKNSGDVNSFSFSNRMSSLKSSLGVFVTNEIYQGKHGTSLKIKGLESGINDNAYDRSIVFHGASYVSDHIAKTNGRIGRSWGCMAVSENIIHPLINVIKNQALIFAYYPDQKWLNHSSFLN